MYLYNIKCLVNDLENDGKHEASSIKMKLLQVDAKHAKQEEHMIAAREATSYTRLRHTEQHLVVTGTTSVRTGFDIRY
jgi:hemerythrin